MLAAASGIAFGGGSGCWSPGSEPSRPKGSDAELQLPEPPELSGVDVKHRYEDGAWTVPGVLDRGNQLVGRTITVRGRVDEVRHCPPSTATAEGPDAGGTGSGRGAGEADAAAGEAADAGSAGPATGRGGGPCQPPPHLYLVAPDAGTEAGQRLLVVGSMDTAVGEAEEGDELGVEGTFDLVSPDGSFIRQSGLIVLDEDDGGGEAGGR